MFTDRVLPLKPEGAYAVLARAQALAGFHAASGFIRREVSTNLRMRHAPEFSFIYDDSIERGSAVLDMLEKLNSET